MLDLVDGVAPIEEILASHLTRTRGVIDCDHCRGGIAPLLRSVRCSSGVVVEISQRGLRNDSGRIMRALVEGETFTVTRNGEPVGELTPLRRHRFVRAEAAVELFRGAAPVDLEGLRRDLDALADQDVEPRA